jgi:hypothetical protein
MHVNVIFVSILLSLVKQVYLCSQQIYSVRSNMCKLMEAAPFLLHKRGQKVVVYVS